MVPTRRHRLASLIRRLSWRNLPFERRILVLSLGSGTPAAAITLLLLWFGDYSAKLQWTVTLFIAIFWLGFAFALRDKVVFPLQTIANLLEALREEDFSIRARRSVPFDVLDQVYQEINTLGETLRSQRLGAVEATALLRKVMAEIDVAVLTFDPEHRLRLVNRAGERLLAQPEVRLLGRTAADLGVLDCLEGETSRTVEKTFPGGVGRWGIRHSDFREGGERHHLLVVADLSKTLREEERKAWQRLIRVIGHELNNSLAPIKSMATTLKGLVARQPRPEDLEEDLARGLNLIEDRASALSRFMTSYSRLAQLPEPRLEPLRVAETVRHVAALETRLPVTVEDGPDAVIRADRAQLEQLLINLVRNAVDAAQETGGGVTIGWSRRGSELELRIEDEGPGLSSTSNLFVPFFTTKREGSGIGLVLSRQIAEAHGGSLTVANRRPGPGCEARVRLPVDPGGDRKMGEDPGSRAR